MRAGCVVSIRVNPEDCQRVLDLMGVLGIDPYDGRSFATCASLSLSSLLSTYQKAGHLPEVDTFQYLNRMGPFLGSRNDKRKKAAADMMYGRAQHGLGAPTLPQGKHPGQYIPEHIQQEAVGFTSAGVVTTASVPLEKDPMVIETLMEEYWKLYAVMKGDDVTQEVHDRFTELQNILAPYL